MKLSKEIEEYLEILYRFKEKGKIAQTKELAKELKVSNASVSEMLRKLSEKGLVKHERYKGAELTKKGEELGKKVLRKHRLIEKFLTLLGVKKSRIHDEACVLEHAVSDDVEKALRNALWSSKNPEIKAENAKRAIDLKGGEKGKIVFIVGGTGVRRRLEDMGLTPGTMITIRRSSRFVGPIEICVRSSCLAIGRGIAEKVFVEVVK